MRFYTLPPIKIFWPHVLINANRPETGLAYVRTHRRDVEAIIIDSGIEIFRDPNVKDYPPGHLKRLVWLYNRVRCLCSDAEVWVTAPDYCDDYHPGALWLNADFTNIERTVESVKRALTEHPEVDWLIPVQGHYREPKSVAYCISLYEQEGILDGRDYIAVANLCTERRHDIMLETILIAERMLHPRRIHVFGLDVDVATKVKRRIFSFDSLAWTFPRSPGLPSCKNSKQRRQYFLAFIKRLEELGLLNGVRW